MKGQILLNIKRARRANRSSAKVSGTSKKPRLSVSRSNRAVSAQLIDDEKFHTIAAASSAQIEKKSKQSKSEQAYAVGELIGQKALSLGIKNAVLDRRSYRYHGRVKAIAEGARKSGLIL